MIKRLIFCLAVLVCASSAWAVAPLTGGFAMAGSWPWWTGGSYKSVADLCAAFAPALATANGAGTVTSCLSGGSNSSMPISVKYASSSQPSTIWFEVVGGKPYCADGSPVDTSKPLALQCPDPPPPSCAKDVVSLVRKSYGTIATAAFDGGSAPTCYQHCTVDLVEVVSAQRGVTSGILSVTYKVKQNGGSCSADDGVPDTGVPGPDDVPSTTPPIKAPGALDCPKGTVQAGISKDGIPLCVGTGTSPNTSTSDSSTTKPPVIVTNADGSTTKTEVTETKNTDGSTTTTTKTTMTKPDGTVTVSVGSSTGNTPAGTPGKPGTNGTNGKDGKDAQNICQTNPELTMCKNSTVAGDCDAAGAAAVACTGDAIQCATLRSAKALQCRQQKDDADLKALPASALGSAVLAGNDPSASSLPAIGNAAKVSMPTSLDTAGFAGGGSPFSDFSFSFRGQTFTIPFAKWSGYLEAFRYVMMVIASLVSFRMLSGAILRD